MRRLVMTTSLGLALLTGSAGACNDPSLHPEMVVLLARMEAIGSQPESPLQLKYRVVGPALIGVQADVMLSFWPKSPVREASYRVETSPGLSTDLPDDWTTLETKGGVVTFKVTPRLGGHHFLEVVSRALPEEGEMIEHRSLVQVPVAVAHETAPGRPDPNGLGFAGQRLREALGK